MNRFTQNSNNMRFLGSSLMSMGILLAISVNSGGGMASNGSLKHYCISCRAQHKQVYINVSTRYIPDI